MYNARMVIDEQALWAAVVARAGMDLAGKKLYGEDPTLARAEALAWLGTEDFDTVCDLAGLPVEETRQTLLREAHNNG